MTDDPAFPPQGFLPDPMAGSGAGLLGAVSKLQESVGAEGDVIVLNEETRAAARKSLRPTAPLGLFGITRRRLDRQLGPVNPHQRARQRHSKASPALASRGYRKYLLPLLLAPVVVGLLLYIGMDGAQTGWERIVPWGLGGLVVLPLALEVSRRALKLESHRSESLAASGAGRQQGGEHEPVPSADDEPITATRSASRTAGMTRRASRVGDEAVTRRTTEGQSETRRARRSSGS